jgi:hypothetical protein
MVDITAQDGHFARTAQTVTAGMRNIDTLTQRCVENSLAILDIDGGAKRFNGQLL